MDNEGRGGSSHPTGRGRTHGQSAGKGGGRARSNEPAASADARRIALCVAAAGLDKKAAAIEIIDVSGKVDYADLLVMMSGRSDRQVAAIARGVEEALRTELGLAPISIEGLTAARWVLIDYNDVVVHVLQEDARCFYDLEGLWIDAARIGMPEPEAIGPASARGVGDGGPRGVRH